MKHPGVFDKRTCYEIEYFSERNPYKTFIVLKSFAEREVFLVKPSVMRKNRITVFLVISLEFTMYDIFEHDLSPFLS